MECVKRAVLIVNLPPSLGCRGNGLLREIKSFRRTWKKTEEKLLIGASTVRAAE